jgi:septal ring factor EnvC (AmiA/AmiB activator)
MALAAVFAVLAQALPGAGASLAPELARRLDSTGAMAVLIVFLFLAFALSAANNLLSFIRTLKLRVGPGDIGNLNASVADLAKVVSGMAASVASLSELSANLIQGQSAVLDSHRRSELQQTSVLDSQRRLEAAIAQQTTELHSLARDFSELSGRIFALEVRRS